MATAKVTFFYRLNTSGWTHSFYHDYTPPLTNLFPQAKNLNIALMGCVTAGTLMDYVRLSDDSIRGDSEIVDFTTSGGGGGGGSWSPQGSLLGFAANPQACIEVRAESGSLKRKSIFFSGVLLADVGAGSPYVPSPAFQNGIQALSTVLTAQNWTFKGRATPGLLWPFLSVTPGALGAFIQWTVTVAGAPPFAIGSKVLVAGVSPRGGGFTGNYYVQTLNTVAGVTTIGLAGGSPLRPRAWIWLGGGYLAPLQSQYNNITALVIRRPGERKRGRPFALRAGRTPRLAATH